MLLSTSPRISTPSDSRHRLMWPAEWPGVSRTAKPPTSSPSRREPVDGVAGSDEGLAEELGDEVIGLALADQRGVLGGGDVVLGHPVGDLELGADLVTGALVVGVGVGECVGGDGVV